jgi:tripartite-type tricarboxylate transporter receptor subunit TctC
MNSDDSATSFPVTRRSVCRLGLAAVSATAGLSGARVAAAANAASFPSSPVTLVLTSQAGNVTDANTRLFASKLAAIWKQPVIVEQKVGANGSIGAGFVARAAPDGHTLLVTTTSLVQTLALRKNLSYDIFKDLAPISEAFFLRLGFFVDAKLGVSSMQDFVKLARANPGKFTFGSFGVGSTGHLLMAKLNHELGIDVQIVPYQGTPAATQALVSGEITSALLDPFLANTYVRKGSLNVLATTGAKRSFYLPNTPTFEQAGIKGFSIDNWCGWFAPGGTPDAITARISADMARVQAAPDVIAAYQKSGIEIAHTTPAEFRSILRRDFNYWDEIVTVAGIKV